MLYMVMFVENKILKYERIRNLRQDNDLSQKQVADMLHVSQNTYAQYETGVLNYPVDVLLKLALFYHTSVDYLLERTDDPTPYERKK